MSILKKILLSLGVVAAAEIPAPAAEPDFAHPRQVLSKAYATLASTEGDADAGPRRVRALLEICTAARSIDPDSVFGLMGTSAELAEKEKSVPARSLMQLIEARLAAGAYQNNRWRYDQIDIPAEPLPADPREWSGLQWRGQIAALSGQAYATAQTCNTPLKDYADAVEADARTLLYFPTVADFVAVEAVALYNIIDDKAKADKVTEGRIAAAAEGTAPWYYWSVRALESGPDSGKRLYDFYTAHQADEYARIALERYVRSAMWTAEEEPVEENSAAKEDAAKEEKAEKLHRKLVEMLEYSLERFPGYWNNNELRNMLAELKRPKATVEYPRIVCPGRPFDVNVSASYAGEAGAEFYHVTPAMLASGRRIEFGRLRPSAAARFTTGREDYSAIQTRQVTLNNPGVYLVNTFVDKDDRDYGFLDYNSMVCTPYVPVAFTGCKEQVVVMADFVSGKPVEGVRVMASRRTGAAPTPMGTTNASGIARFKTSTDQNYQLSAITPEGQSLFFGNKISLRSPWRGRQGVDDRNISVSIMPARAIYHPGDTLEWALVADSYDKTERRRTVAARLRMEVTLHDANSQPVDTINIVTDAFGRAFGSFAIPKEGLTGDYSIVAGAGGKSVGSEDVMVSDFRMPTFEVKVESTFRDKPKRGDVTIEGVATTYSGMPVAGARVEATISEALRWRWWQSAAPVGTVEAQTDATGRFSATVPAEMLESHDVHDFTAKLLVTATTAESATAECSFTTGRPYLIVVDATGYIKATGKTLLPVKVYGADGKPADIALTWALTEKGSKNTVARGRCMSGNPVADLDQVHGGYYRLTVEAEDAALADKAVSADFFTLYNIELNSLPADLPLLVESDRITADENGRAAVQYGVAHSSTWVYAGLCVGEEIVEVEAQKRGKGFRHLTLDLPGKVDNGKLVMFAISDGHITSYYVDVVRKHVAELEISAESFRDRLVPGEKEHWTFRVKGAGGEPADAAMVATLYNQALDDLAMLSWPSRFALPQQYPAMQLETLPEGDVKNYATADVKRLKTEMLRVPGLKYWQSQIYIRGSRMMKMSAMATGAVMNDMAVMEEAEEESADLAEARYDTASIKDEEAKEAGQHEPFDYREAEVPQAFWRPDLTTDAEGRVTIDFDVPNANTTWSLEALAWTEDMKSGNFIRSILANKPVMVQPNLPRFLRAGDKATVPATVYNNSDTAATVQMVVELFDPSTMQVTTTSESSARIEPAASATAAIAIEAPADAAAVGYRVRAYMGQYSDGEQSLIPVESAECDVVESVPFYLNPGDKSISVKIPKDKNGRYTLQYCQNPSWSIVKALPGLVTYDPTTTPGAVNAIFAAATARGIVERTPAVSDAIAAWGDKDLTSRLAQNDALKIATLKATPWVQAAQSDSERMARLSLLLDGKMCKENIDKAVKVLKSLQEGNGGFRWGTWSDEASLWPTMTAAHDLGLLRMAGYLPAGSGLDGMMRRALAYIDKELEDNAYDKKIHPDMGYAVVRSMWPDVEPSAFGRKVINATIRDCIESWRKASTASKANMAILLSLYKHESVAREIIGSVDEFAVSTPAQGVSFPSVSDIEQYAPLLMAYGKVKPTSKLIDGMRQWLVIREQATVGLGACDATQLIAAILNSGTPWHTDNAPAAVKLAGKAVDLGDACAWGGEATVALPSAAAGKTLTVEPGANVPSYGAVISSYRAKPSDVKAASCEAISIEKRLMTVSGDSTARYADRVDLGQRVRVVLTLHVERDMQYVTVVDNRAAGLEPIDQLPGYVTGGGARFYRENRDAATNLFISYLPKGVYQISYDCVANTAGTFAAGLASVQSALAPALTAHSAGAELEVAGR